MKNLIIILMLLSWCSCQPRQTRTTGSPSTQAYKQAGLYILNPDGKSGAAYVYLDDSFKVTALPNGTTQIKGDSLSLTFNDPMTLNALSGMVERQPISELAIESRHVNTRFYQKDYDNITMEETDTSLTLRARSEYSNRYNVMVIFKK